MPWILDTSNSVKKQMALLHSAWMHTQNRLTSYVCLSPKNKYPKNTCFPFSVLNMCTWTQWSPNSLCFFSIKLKKNMRNFHKKWLRILSHRLGWPTLNFTVQFQRCKKSGGIDGNSYKRKWGWEKGPQGIQQKPQILDPETSGNGWNFFPSLIYHPLRRIQLRVSKWGKRVEGPLV